MGTVTILETTTKCGFPNVVMKKDDGTEIRFIKGIPRNDFIGKKFGKLTVTEYLGECAAGDEPVAWEPKEEDEC